jgi:hypothetical protein
VGFVEMAQSQRLLRSERREHFAEREISLPKFSHFIMLTLILLEFD